MKEMNDSCNSEQQKNDKIISQKILTQQNLQEQPKIQSIAKFLLTAAECSFIQRFFPNTYSFQQVGDNRSKNKKKIAKTSNTYCQNYFNVPQNELENGLSNQQSASGTIKKKSKAFATQLDSIEYKNLGSPIRRVEQNDYEGCCSILANLKKHRLSNHFLDYMTSNQLLQSNFQHLVKEPIDLSIVEKKLNQGKYESTSKFKSDIIKIWHNVFACNEKTTQIYKMAKSMQKYYEKLVSDYDDQRKRNRNQRQQREEDKNKEQKKLLQITQFEGNQIVDKLEKGGQQQFQNS